MNIQEKLTKKVESLAVNREKCKECPLRGNTLVTCELVPPDTPKNECGVLFIGINPGVREAKEGRPFCGPSGQLLRSTIEECNKRNFPVGFTNAILCSTPGEADIGDIGYVYSKCKGLSEGIIKRINPKIYVPVGRSATQLIFGLLDPITRIAGKYFDIEEKIIVPLVHPSAVLRGGTSRDAFREQMESVFSYINDNEIQIDIKSSETPKIDKFEGDYYFLSNFSWSPFTDRKGRLWVSVEHYFQAHKTLSKRRFLSIWEAPTPGEAKKLGRDRSAGFRLRPNWESLKLKVMAQALKYKFFQNTELRVKLLDTGEAELIEGNTWGDSFWGYDIKRKRGENHLGKLLMKLRKEWQDLAAEGVDVYHTWYETGLLDSSYLGTDHIEKPVTKFRPKGYKPKRRKIGEEE